MPQQLVLLLFDMNYLYIIVLLIIRPRHIIYSSFGSKLEIKSLNENVLY